LLELPQTAGTEDRVTDNQNPILRVLLGEYHSNERGGGMNTISCNRKIQILIVPVPVILPMGYIAPAKAIQVDLN
jgi:hypothetical protein